MLLKRVLRIVGFLFGGLVVLLLLTIGGVWLNAQRLMTQRHTNPVQNVTVEATPEQVSRGAYLVSAMPGCAGCHSTEPLAERPVLNGRHFTDFSALATLYAPNLTPGGRLKDWSDGEIIRAIREGIDRDGRAMMLMPSENFRHLSDTDVRAIVAYLRSQPAVPGDTPKPSLTPLGTALVGAGQFTLGNQAPVGSVSAPPRGPTPEYGAYLSQVSNCGTCHGAALDGQDIPQGPPPGPNLRIVKGWTEEQFFRTMREGVDPSGKRLTDEMPWREFGRGTDDDLCAVYAYLKSLP
jgi:mono/diheme cytochrome c family protein